ncbi:MAG: glycosyltransferase family 9 protein [Thermodesulfovibrionales bacterium]|nr:glycosyltransferase family 9 protein [Thermodesulfovibrionales bacterium]
MKRFIDRFKNSAIKKIITLSQQLNVPKRNNRRAIPSRFLVVSTTGIGDTLWGTPAIRALKETYPDSYLGVLTNQIGSELLQENPNIDEFFIFRRGGRAIFSLPVLLKILRQKKFEVAFIFHASDRVIWPLVFFTGAGEIIGTYDTKGLDFILTRSTDQLLHSHAIENRLALVRQLGANTEDRALELYLTVEERNRMEQFLKDRGINRDVLIVGLHPGAKNVYRRWPSKNFIDLGNILIKKLNCQILITGSKKENSLVDEISAKINGAIPIAGKLSIRESAALIEKMDLFITNDTGPMHIAFALETPTIAMLSPSNPNNCGPYKAKGKYRIIKKPQTCTPCIYKKCYNPVCMEHITVEEVVADAESLLGSKAREGKNGKHV